MRLLRHPLVLRTVAALLLVGTGAAWAPAATAQAARPQALRSLLGDADAFRSAVAASRDADFGKAVDAFAEAYAEAAGDAVSPEAVRQLLAGQGVGDDAPVPRDVVFVPGGATTPLASASPGVLGDAPPPPVVGGAVRSTPPAARSAAGGAAHAVQARGP
ncbi:hypothetical protein RQM47_09560 [Rubrivirga sp. S365]|uniref:Uncharacterized protein n=1 Tax=Rubrivirga litoralis TaxID=3075598 RepID=A0ABU3BVB0_9BACT|nr:MULTISPECIES: hypothetical protein [unclassified Rubrivirga]MDT0633229.1 hypothetical protein [Rubrivirga sp. F394]MDT7856885.1 hypothetical protein [Rubrivirga sp. S365]